ncbi:DNA repair and recombination protein RAD26 [Candida viswanathii]|uniref:DNA repair and recombination protein RAD26 n=1 Tax=Candida viswanathii TaxID=5486 RepID=A0A367XVJ5_9ASCO|nr:DNA repair and recombination protein RAD26 [Candida viswanathii]
MSELDELDVKLVDQDELETSITKKANKVLLLKDVELDEKRLEKATKVLDRTKKQITALSNQLSNPRTKISEKKRLKDEIAYLEENDLVAQQQDVDEIKKRLLENTKQINDKTQAQGDTTGRLPDESERDYLIRTGKITAFGNENAFQLGDQHELEQRSHVYLRAPGLDHDTEPLAKPGDEGEVGDDNDDDDYVYEDDKDEVVEDDLVEDELVEEEEDETRNIDDGDEALYQKRLQSWIRKRSSLRLPSEEQQTQDTPEWLLPHPTISDAKLNETFKLPGDIYPSLFDYQKTCVQWLWELYSQKTGGIIGDEMGLGKTIQIISFLAGLHYSGLLDKPVLVVVPATVLNQWVNEFHRWWPPLRCVILHSIGSGMNGKNVSETKMEEFLETADPNASKNSLLGVKSQINAKEIIDRVMEKGHVLVTTYVGLRIYSNYILPREWGYVVLDEGHKIRNPDLDISLTCKKIRTVNRIILSGTPIQNNLIELWSLFDFVFPGRLGTLPVFQQQFSMPINIGGYANSNNLQVKTAYKCAVVLRDLISPYMLRRLKTDVAKDLPKKNEMVLFVKLTKPQQELYEKFLQSEDLDSILKGKRNVLMGVDILRKICNHPDLVYREAMMKKRGYGDPARSGKMQVLKNLLQIWQSEDHKTLLFCQTRQMLDILEKFVANLLLLDGVGGFNYLRMDGSTPIARRQALVDKFNGDPTMHVFLLTTKVGGLGVNLTGADRVIIYDPDWNPSTDVQARERAWRLGQKKDITIYRLMTTGSIEEKIYHRQIFKTFLTNKILKDPKQRRFFKANDLHDLFTLGDQDEEGTETAEMFQERGNNSGGSSMFKKKYKNDDDFYQVAKITGVSKLDKFEDGEDEEDTDKASSSRDDSRVMSSIFATGGVHSTLMHDELVGSQTREDPTNMIETEASKIANAAAEALKESRKQARKNKIGVPTWTGKFGSAPKKRKLNSSTSILANLKKKNEIKDLQQKAAEVPLDRKQMIEKLVAYLNTTSEKFSTSNDIVKKVELSMTSEEDMVLIRSMLREIATWDSARKGWKLKNEFADD